AAKCVGLASEIGSIEAGKKADLILIEGNPLDDVSILERGKAVRYVMKDGVTYVDNLTTAG
ncbi:MAG: amidohydrolase family protein, partial [Chloroflexi bacterium]|nr:amidohydrolase family protein [Chloroflexota bacterium]